MPTTAAAEPFRLKADALLPLSVRSDGPAALHALGHLGLIAVAGTAVWALRGSAWVALPTVLLGVAIAFLFNAMHECAHQTAFRTRRYNLWLGHLAGFAVLLPYGYYRAFHWDHHRYTQDPERDPELAIPLARTWRGRLWYVLGAPVWKDRIRMLLVHGLRGSVTERWVPADQRAAIVREARAHLLGHAVVLSASLAAGSLAAVWLWLLPVAVGQWFLRPYLLCEHTGCAHSDDMLANTRTTRTHALVRFLAWNMPYHAEHHAYPAVPFHALPALHGLLQGRIVHVERGYPASIAAVLRHLARRTPARAAGTVGMADDGEPRAASNARRAP